MKKIPKISNILEKIYFENTLVAIIMMALAVFFGKTIFPDNSDKILNLLIPIFIIAACLEIYFIRTKLMREVYLLRNTTENRFTIDQDIEAESVVNDIRKAKSSIRVTHFSKRIPNKSYIDTMLKKIKSGIDVTRIIPKENSDMKWLVEFNSLERRYTQKEVDSNLQFDMLIIDENKIRLNFPSTSDSLEFKRIISFNNEEFARIFITLFDRIK